jgi:4-diphosphocytidyl-2-C-methyl-D-erythritol kinase
MLTVKAPAKINLTLEVLSKRNDGFHEISSVIQTIDLYDRLIFQASQDIAFRSDMPEWNAEKSLVSRAVTLVRETTGYSGGVAIEVEKSIPLMSGLGGDSSDAAAVLRALNRLWELDLPPEKLHQMAVRLGSDVAFFLYGGTTLVEGRGEMVTPLPPLPRMWVVLAVPSVPGPPDKTKQLYESLNTNHYTDGQITQKFIEELKAGRGLKPSLLLNTFENVAFTVFPGLDVAREHFLKLGAVDVHLAGSGPVLFTLVEDRVKAEELYALLHSQRLNPVIAETISDIEKQEVNESGNQDRE